MVELDELTALDLAAMFAMSAIVARGDNAFQRVSVLAYDYAEALMAEKIRREAEAEE